MTESSLSEVEYLLLVSRDLGYLAADTAEPLFAEVSEISRMLYAPGAKVEQGAQK